MTLNVELQNPYDVRAAVDAVMQQIALSKVQNTRAPTIILMGEHHDMIVSQILQIAVMKACLDNGLSVAYGMEYPRNLALQLKPAFNKMAGNGYDAFWEQEHINTVFAAPDVMSFHENAKWQYKGRFCHENGISVSFNDAARAPNGLLLLNLNDKQVAKAIHDLGYEGQCHSFPLARPDGVHIRNLVMARNIVEHVKSMPSMPDVYVQMLGNVHVLGEHNDDIMQRYPYHESVDCLLRENGYDPVSMNIYHEDCPVPADANLTKGVFIRGWDDARTSFKDEDDVARHITYISKCSKGAVPEFKKFTDSEQIALSRRLCASFANNLPRGLKP